MGFVAWPASAHRWPEEELAEPRDFPVVVSPVQACALDESDDPPQEGVHRLGPVGRDEPQQGFRGIRARFRGQLAETFREVNLRELHHGFGLHPGGDVQGEAEVPMLQDRLDDLGIEPEAASQAREGDAEPLGVHGLVEPGGLADTEDDARHVLIGFEKGA